MPVLVTAAHRPLPHRIASRLLDEGGEVRVVASGDVGALRAGGAFVSVATPDDEGRIEAALEQVHTLVHDASDPFADPDEVRHDAEVVARAATGARVRRVVLLSLPGANPGAADPRRRAAAAAEAAIAAVACPTVVVRPGPVDTVELRDACRVAPTSLAEVVLPVVHPDDLVALVVALDRARSSAGDGHLVVGAPGPLALTVRDYLERVGVAPPGRGGAVGWRLPDEEVTTRLHTVLGGPWVDPETTLLDGWRFAGLQPRPPGDEPSAGRG